MTEITLADIDARLIAIQADLSEIKQGVAEDQDDLPDPVPAPESVVKVEFAPRRERVMRWRDGGTPLLGVDSMRARNVGNRSFCGRYLITAVKGNVTIDKISVSGRHNVRFEAAPHHPELVEGFVIREGESVAVDSFVGPLTGNVTATWEQVGWFISTRENGVILNVGRQIVDA